MKLSKKSLLLVMITLLIIFGAGCGDLEGQVEDLYIEDRPVEKVVAIKNQFDHLLDLSDQYLKNSLNRTITAEEVYQKIVIDESPEYLVVDIRTADDYSKGAIKTSVNIPLEYTANTYQLASLPKDKTLIVVCYTGHMAGHTVPLWNMLGYDAITMINGMAGWTKSEVAGSVLPTASFNFPLTTVTSTAPAKFDPPTFMEETVATVYDLARVKSKLFLESDQELVVRPAEVQANIGNNEYYVVDIRTAADYSKGHIAGAIHIPYESLAERANLEKLPTDTPIVLAGYHGTDGAQAARVLNQLGYDAYALLYGMRLWSDNSDLIGYKAISAEQINNLPTVELKYDLDAVPTGSAGCS